MIECLKKLEDCFYIVKNNLKEADNDIKSSIYAVEIALELLISSMESKEEPDE